MADVVTDGMVAVKADLEALGFLADVLHEAWLGSQTVFGLPVPRRALVQEGNLRHERADGQVIRAKARVSFVGPVPPNGTPGREEPVDPRDRFTLPSGTVARVVENSGILLDSVSGFPYVGTLWLG